MLTRRGDVVVISANVHEELKKKSSHIIASLKRLQSEGKKVLFLSEEVVEFDSTPGSQSGDKELLAIAQKTDKAKDVVAEEFEEIGIDFERVKQQFVTDDAGLWNKIQSDLAGWGLQPHPERFRLCRLAEVAETFRQGLQTPAGEDPIDGEGLSGAEGVGVRRRAQGRIGDGG